MSVKPSRFDDIPAPPLEDPSYVFDRFYADTCAQKFNLRSISYKDEEGNAWSHPLIDRIKLTLAMDDSLKNRYLPCLGLSRFNDVTAKLLLGETSPAILENKILNMHTPTSVCSIKVATTFLLECLHYTVVYLSLPYDDKIRRIFAYSGYTDIRYYTYWSREQSRVDFDAMRNDLEFAPENSVVFLYVAAHNPTGYDLTAAQWTELAGIIKAHRLYPFFYCDSLGLCSGNVNADAHSIRLFVENDIELMCVHCLEASFCLYADRASTLLLYTLDAGTLINLETNLSRIAFALYNSPNMQAARLMTYALNSEQFYLIWEENVTMMAERIRRVRKLLRSTLEVFNTPGDWSILTHQNGIFAYIPLTDTQVAYLMDKHHVYLSDNGRFNVTAINNDNVRHIAAAFNDAIVNVA